MATIIGGAIGMFILTRLARLVTGKTREGSVMAMAVALVVALGLSGLGVETFEQWQAMAPGYFVGGAVCLAWDLYRQPKYPP